MGFFGGVFKALGFESETKVKKNKKSTKATYKLNSDKYSRTNQIDGVPVYYPENLEQLVEFVEFVKNKKAIIISLQDCDKEMEVRINDYVRGFIKGSNSKIVNLDENKLFLLLPEGMEIEE